MELKLRTFKAYCVSTSCLNRTFYGIETPPQKFPRWGQTPVLIVPFMELKQVGVSPPQARGWVS